jgi:serine protease inhibitor
MDNVNSRLSRLLIPATFFIALPIMGLSEVVKAETETTDMKLVVDSVNRFSIDLYHEIAGAEPSANAFLSPYSITTRY